jgi:hypothetical protein
MKCKFIEEPKTDMQMAALVTNNILSDEEMKVIEGGTECGIYKLCRNCSEKIGKRSCEEYFNDTISCGTYTRFLTGELAVSTPY